MKKYFFLIILIFSFTISFANASFVDFVTSPNKDDLVIIKNTEIRECEQIFLEAYMRREFSETENQKCRNIFAKKIEDEIDYKINVLKDRGIY